jgi:hypothetical protein
MMGDFMRFHSDEPLDTLLNPHRAEEQDAAKAAGAARLQALGVRLTGTENSDEIGSLLDAVERFEAVVEMRGGDLMIDEGPHGRTTEPDNPEFVLPKRVAHESVNAFTERLAATTERLRHRQTREENPRR